jgi:hypothetical protein
MCVDDGCRAEGQGGELERDEAHRVQARVVLFEQADLVYGVLDAWLVHHEHEVEWRIAATDAAAI